MSERSSSPAWLRGAADAWHRSRLVRPVLTLVSGTALAQAAVFAARPALTRLFTPEDFGVLTVFTTLVAVGTTVASGGYRYALLLPRPDERAAGLLALALACAVGAAALAALGVAGASGVLVDPAMRAALWLLPPTLLLADAVQTFEQWHVRFDRFRLVSGVRVAQSGAVVVAQLGAGVAGAGALGLVGGAVLGFLVALVGSAGAFWGRDRAKLAAVTRHLVGRLARRYQRFPRFSAPAALLNLSATRAPVLLLAVFFGSGVVGQFGIAYGSMALPIGLLTSAVGQVFFVRAAEAHRAGTLAALTRRVLRGLWLVTLFPALAVLVAGPSLFAFVFGDVWVEAGRYAQLTAPWVLLASVAAALTPVFDVLERQRADLAFSGVMFTVQVTAVALASWTLPAAGAVLAAGIAGAVLRLAHLGWMLRLAEVDARPVAADAAVALARTLPFVAVVAAVEWAGVGAGWTFAATVAAGLAGLAVNGRREAGVADASAS